MKMIIDNLIKLMKKQQHLHLGRGNKGEVVGIDKSGNVKVTPLFQDESLYLTKVENKGVVTCYNDGVDFGGQWLAFLLCLGGEISFEKEDRCLTFGEDEILVYSGDRPISFSKMTCRDFRGLHFSLQESFMEVGTDQDLDLSITKYWQEEKETLLQGRSWAIRRGNSTFYALANHLFSEFVKNPMDYLHMKRESLEIIQILFESFFRKEELWKRVIKMNEDRQDQGEYTLGELSDHLGMSKYKINQHFLEVHGKTYVEYLRHRKIEEAGAMLLETQKSIIDIAAEIGFENPGKFSAMFKREVGKTPREFRKEGKDNLVP